MVAVVVHLIVTVRDGSLDSGEPLARPFFLFLFAAVPPLPCGALNNDTS